MISLLLHDSDSEALIAENAEAPKNSSESGQLEVQQSSMNWCKTAISLQNPLHLSERRRNARN
jgi:hypothetical protein